MPLQSRRIFIYNSLMLLIPETSFFGLKRALLRWCGARVGCSVRICSSSRFLGCGELEIGDESWVGHQCLFVATARIRIGAYVDIGPNVYIGTGTHEIDPHGRRSAGQGISRCISIGDGCWLGARSLVLPGICIGDKAVVAAGAVVSKDVGVRSIVAGIPARLIGSVK